MDYSRKYIYEIWNDFTLQTKQQQMYRVLSSLGFASFHQNCRSLFDAVTKLNFHILNTDIWLSNTTELRPLKQNDYELHS